MDIPKQKKILYVPGVISAVILPVAFAVFANREVQKLSITGIPFYCIDTTRLQHLGINFLPRRNYTTVVLNGNVHDDQIKIEFYQIKMREILSQNDTLEGLHFVFEDSSHYGSFVALLDKLRIDDAKYYFAVNNDLWFFDEHEHLNTTKPIPMFSYGSSNNFLPPETTWWIKTKEALGLVWISSWQIIVLFFWFIVAVLVLKLKKKRD